MCGFVGLFQSAAKPIVRERVLRARDVISHRGPDDSGIYADEYIGIGHVRLSILDLSNMAAQPMVSRSGRFIIAYNGEVYNFRELKRELQGKGKEVPHRSTGDTEAILEYIAEFGVERCLEVMEGMFAFALWDRQEKAVTLARDRHGIKPLYFAVKPDGEVGFASEIKGLLDFSSGPDYTTVNAAMLGLGCTWDSRTLLKGVESLRAGEYVTFRVGSSRPVRKMFFELPDFVEERRYKEILHLPKSRVLDSVHEALEESMRLCMISDAPLAVLVSGGVDSSLIAAMAAKTYPNLKLFHANVVGASETAAAEALARHIGCELSSATVTDQDTLNYTPVVTYHYEMPLMYHTNAVPFYLVSRLVANHGIKVVLTGEGSDEYFIGYAAMAIWPYIQAYRRTIKRIQDVVHWMPGLGRFLWPKSDDDLVQHLRKTLFRYELEERRGRAERTYAFIPDWKKRLLSFMSLDMCEGNIPPLLQRNDRLGMAWGLESRFPFLGHSVAKLALNLPSDYKVRKTMRFYDWRHPYIVDKWCVRKVAERYLSPELAYRGKYAFRSVAYQRLQIKPAFFLNGFVADFYGLERSRLELMQEMASPEWKSRLFFLEIWGRMFCWHKGYAELEEVLRSNVSVRAA